MAKHWFLTLFCHKTGSSSSKFNIHRCNMKHFSRRFQFLRSRWWVYGRKVDLYRKCWFYIFDFPKISRLPESTIDFLSVFIGFRSLSRVKMVVLNEIMTFVWICIEKVACFFSIFYFSGVWMLQFWDFEMLGFSDVWISAFCWPVCWFGWLVGWMIDWWVGWLICWLAWLTDWLVGWLFGWLVWLI